MIRISGLIQELEKVKEKHGDIPVAFKKPVTDEQIIRWVNDNTWISEVAYKIQETDDGLHEVYPLEVETKTLYFY